MKKIMFLALFIVGLTACVTEQDKYGQGGRNACQFVKEQVPELRDDIDKIEVVEEDSLLSDNMLSFGRAQFANAGSDFWNKKITRQEYKQIIDSTANAIQDVQYSWQYSVAVNDSLKQLEKYKQCWRKVYTIRVTMKSGTTQEQRILMDSDGITPRMLEKDFFNKLQEYTDKALQALDDIFLNYN